MSRDDVDWQALIQKRIEVLEFEFDVYALGLYGDAPGDADAAGDRTSANAIAGAIMEMQMLARYLGVTVRVRVPNVPEEDDQRYPSSELYDEAQAARQRGP